ncbi:unnamed protein product [Acanthoscelides obtectus]|uniref:DUF4780 domain-containing protein n=1 Tax=Acanthoscelides obtectus TaxID=200917 RepID=A0A9P0LPD9_ACAOB|nr:unnamed protein product [Acanthoscelides obtectus]CAK1656562.1 hypothetical protein AOBTE_LOCUS19803 [Acanthoscelides obtectus]
MAEFSIHNPNKYNHRRLKCRDHLNRRQGPRKIAYEEAQEHLREEREEFKRLFGDEYNRGVRKRRLEDDEDQPRGDLRGARENRNQGEGRSWRSEDNDQQRGNHRGGRFEQYDGKERNQRPPRGQGFKENGNCSREPQGSTRGARFKVEDYQRGDQTFSRVQRYEGDVSYPGRPQRRPRFEVEGYQMGEQTFEVQARDDSRDLNICFELELLEREKLEVRRLEAKLQRVLGDAGPTESECYDDSNEEYYDDRDGETHEEEDDEEEEEDHHLEEQSRHAVSEYPVPPHVEAAIFRSDKDIEVTSYHSEDEIGWKFRKVLERYNEDPENGWYGTEKPQSTSCSNVNQCNTDVGRLSSRPTQNRPSTPPSRAKPTSQATDDPDYKFIIVSMGHPENPIGRRVQFRKLRQFLHEPWKIRGWATLPLEKRQIYGIKNVTWDKGIVTINCSNPQTRDWLVSSVPYLKPFRGASLKIIEEWEAQADPEGIRRADEFYIKHFADIGSSVRTTDEPQPSTSRGIDEYDTNIAESSSRMSGDRSLRLGPTPQTSNTDTGLKVTVVSEGYPETSIGKKIQFDKLKRCLKKPWILKRWYILPEHIKQEYDVKDIVWSAGKVIVTCGNIPTRDWLNRYVRDMKPFKDAQLKTLVEEEESCNRRPKFSSDRTTPSENRPLESLPKDRSFVIMTGVFRKLYIGNELLLKLIEKQNKDIDTSNWKILSRKELQNNAGIELSIAIDPAMATIIAQKMFKLYCAYFEVFLHLQKS